MLAIGLVADLSCSGGGSGESGDCPTCTHGQNQQTLAQIVITPSAQSIVVGQSANFTAQGLDATGAAMSGLAMTWSTTDTSVATVAGGAVTARSVGTVALHAAVGSILGTATVNVTQVPVSTVLVTLDSSTLAVSHTAHASAVAKDASGNILTGRAVSWTSDTPAVAAIDPTSGVVIGVSPGTAKLTATVGGTTGTITITITRIPVATVAVTLDSASLQVGHTAHATAVTMDANGNVLTGRVVGWSSGTPSVAMIDAATGVITAVTAGPAQITATVEGKTGSATITVTALPPTALRITGVVSPLAIDDNATAIAGASLADASGQPVANLPTGYTINWSSTATATATVTRGSPASTATIAGQRGGRAIISASLVQTSTGTTISTDAVTVNVQQVPTSIAIVSGSVATSTVAAVLPAPLVVKLADRYGGADSGAVVRFQLTTPVGQLGSLSTAQVTTGAAGTAGSTVTLSTKSGVNTLSVDVPARPTLTPLVTTTYANPGTVASVNVMRGNNQLGATGALLPVSVVFQFLDRYSNPTPGVSFTMRQTDGNGLVGSPVSDVALTDTTRAFPWTLTPVAGSQFMSVQVAGITVLPGALATATARVPVSACYADPNGTCYANPYLSWGGALDGTIVVFDASHVPIPGVQVNAYMTANGTPTQTIAAARGGGLPVAGASNRAGTTPPNRTPASARTNLTPNSSPRIGVAPTSARLLTPGPRSNAKFASGGVIDIRGSSTGNNSLIMQTLTTPEVDATLALYNPDPSPFCQWQFQGFPNGLTSLSLYAGQATSLNTSATCLEYNPNFSYTLANSTNSSAPIAVDPQVQFDQSESVFINALDSGTVSLQLQVDYLKVQPSGTPEPPFPAEQDFAPISVKVLLPPQCSWHLVTPTTLQGWPKVRIGEKVSLQLQSTCNPNVSVAGLYNAGDQLYDFPDTFAWSTTTPTSGAVILGNSSQQTATATGQAAGTVTLTVHVVWNDHVFLSTVPEFWRLRQQDVPVSLVITP